jgi:hypothetical protein
MPEAATETGIAEKFAPLRRDVSANAPEAKTPVGMSMWKKVLLASAVTGLLTGAAIPLQTTPADASRSGCREAAKAKFPDDLKGRRAYRHYCRSQWKAYRAAHGLR